MLRNALAAAAVGLLCCIPASLAGASTRSLSGPIAGDPNGRVSMTIVIRKGEPRRVTQFRFKRLDHECTDSRDRQYSRSFPGGIEINPPLLTGKYIFFATAPVKSGPGLAPGGLFVRGALRRSANRVDGGKISSTIRFPSDQPSGETTCTTYVKFTATR